MGWWVGGRVGGCEGERKRGGRESESRTDIETAKCTQGSWCSLVPRALPRLCLTAATAARQNLGGGLGTRLVVMMVI